MGKSGGGSGRGGSGGAASSSSAPPKTVDGVAPLPKGVNENRWDGFVSFNFVVDNNEVSMSYKKEGRHKEVVFSVNGNLSTDENINSNTGKAILRTLRDIHLYEVSKSKEGQTFKTSAWAGDKSGKKRVSAYMRMGFSKPREVGDNQYAVVKNGKLVPSNAKGKPLNP